MHMRGDRLFWTTAKKQTDKINGFLGINSCIKGIFNTRKLNDKN